MTENIERVFQRERINRQLGDDFFFEQIQELVLNLERNDTQRDLIEQKRFLETLESKIRAEQHYLNQRKKFLSKISKRYLRKNQTTI